MFLLVAGSLAALLGTTDAHFHKKIFVLKGLKGHHHNKGFRHHHKAKFVPRYVVHRPVVYVTRPLPVYAPTYRSYAQQQSAPSYGYRQQQVQPVVVRRAPVFISYSSPAPVYGSSHSSISAPAADSNSYSGAPAPVFSSSYSTAPAAAPVQSSYGATAPGPSFESVEAPDAYDSAPNYGYGR